MQSCISFFETNSQNLEDIGEIIIAFAAYHEVFLFSVVRQLHRVDTQRVFRLHAPVARKRHRLPTRRIFRLYASAARQLHRVDTRRIFRLHASVARQLCAHC